MRCSEQFDEYLARVEIAQASSLYDTAENLLRLGTSVGAIATRHLSIHHRRPERLLGEPVGDVDRQIEEEPKDRR